MTGIEATRRLSQWSLPLALGVVAGGGCGGTVVQDNHRGTGGAAGAVVTRAGSSAVGAGARTGASAAGSPSTAVGSGSTSPGGVSLGQGGAGFGTVPPPPGSGGGMAVVFCGANVCVPPPSPLPGFVAQACCVDAFAGICGTITTSLGGSCQPPAKPDPRCPSAQTPFGSSSGCCINNACGIDLSAAGLGCVDVSNPMLSAFFPGMTPMHCDGTSHAGTGGTGSTDAGVVKDASTSDSATGAGGVDAGKEH